jgi:hypothetical protein
MYLEKSLEMVNTIIGHEIVTISHLTTHMMHPTTSCTKISFTTSTPPFGVG